MFNYVRPKDHRQPVSMVNEQPDVSSYGQANRWYEDVYTSIELSRNRYRVLSVFFACLLLGQVALMLCLFPLQRLVPLMIDHYPDGRVDVKPINHALTMTQSMINSDIVRYVVNRESFESHAFSSQYELVNALSSQNVARTYRQQQSSHNPASPIRQLKRNAYRDVYIDSVVILDMKKHLAQVNFVINDHVDQRVSASFAKTALVRWQYRKPAQDPAIRWLNWNGFSVEQYQVEPRHVS